LGRSSASAGGGFGWDAQKADELSRKLREKGIARFPEIHYGPEGMLAVGAHSKADIVVSAAVGVVGLEATYEAVKLGKTVALSNKEVLVAAGELVMAAARKAGRELLPVDSEHNAVASMLAWRDARRSSAAGTDSLRRAVSKDAPGGASERHHGTGAGPSQLAGWEIASPSIRRR